MLFDYHNEHQRTLSKNAISQALFENYESLYAVDIETSAYQCFHESDSYSALEFESSGNNFFITLDNILLRTVYKEDLDYVKKALKKETIIDALASNKYYSVIYRLMIDKKPIYHKLRATKETVNFRPHILIGIRNIDQSFRKMKLHEEEIDSLHKKEKNHLEAILASSAAYLEVNLSKDTIMEYSPLMSAQIDEAKKQMKSGDDAISYTEFEIWKCSNLVTDNKSKYMEISNRNYLINCFERGEKRASVSFSFICLSGEILQRRKVFYLYRDGNSGDILAFCVVYDLTEQQRKEKEMKDLEEDLKMCRIHNSTSQMQPHFLYNVLGSIQEIILENPEYASELLGDLTIHLRGCVRAMENDSPIPFSQELKNIKAYVNIEKMRFGDKLIVQYDIKNDSFSVPPLSIQPIVENAIQHGIFERGIEGGMVLIRTEESENSWKVIVEDTGIGFDYNQFISGKLRNNNDSTGLKNIMFRLKKILGADIFVESDIGLGTAVSVIIPKKWNKQ